MRLVALYSATMYRYNDGTITRDAGNLSTNSGLFELLASPLCLSRAPKTDGRTTHPDTSRRVTCSLTMLTTI